MTMKPSAIVICALVALAAPAGATRLAAQTTARTPAAPRRNIAGPGDYSLREKLVHLMGRDDALSGETFRIILVNGGAVFSGNVKNCALKRRALMIAATTRGIVNVTDEMTVPRGDAPDAELAKSVISLLGPASEDLGLKDLDAQVVDGVLTLQGTTKNISSRMRAEEIAGTVAGVTRVSNRLRAADAPSGTDDASTLNAVVSYLGDFRNYSYASDLRVGIEHGIVTMNGRVGLFMARQQAALAAAQVNGVVRVENRIKVDPSLVQRRTLVQAEK